MVEIPADPQEEIADWDRLNRWERSELGRELRRSGLSYGEIMELIPVPKGTLAGWCRDIELTPPQVAAIKQRRGPRAGPRDTQWKRRLEIERIQDEASKEALELIRDPFWVAGVVLYWGEGSKSDRKLELTNSDPRALRMFMAWTREYISRGAEFVASLNLHADNNELAARRYWQEQLTLRASDFTKTFIKPDGTGHRKNHLKFGVCRIRLRRGTDGFIRTMVWIDHLASAMTGLRNGHPD